MLNFIKKPAFLGSHFPSAIPIRVDDSSEVPSLLSSAFKPKENLLEQNRGKEETAAPKKTALPYFLCTPGQSQVSLRRAQLAGLAEESPALLAVPACG